MDTAFFTAWITRAAEAVEADRARLSDLDAAIGDGDHGTNLDRGFAGVLRVLDSTDARTPANVLALTGTTLISKVGGASGPLYGSAFRRAANILGEAEQVDLPGLAAALEAALAAVRKLGAARDGDKTMVDALAPAVAALGAAAADGAALLDALDAMVDAANAGAEATIPMQASKGRASYLGPRSIGHLDPGAASTVLILTALRDTAAAAARSGPDVEKEPDGDDGD
ncbi:dihydroxyacetone kinase subunit L [Actinocrinis puniceicyclus]|uniref:Dihydroxyacetone kinase subunit L n=1 Tax=Actinocrinis puniceicyclus TaxID=977794 RepID=A0A8J7WQQ2_9ACTN|nr:dihydroxyacetone kinase subunit L [Actinocrinis puniceicyclus]